MKKIAITLLWITSFQSCASSLKQLPRLENRALRIDSEKPGFKYQYQKCTGKLLWRKCHIETEYFDFTKKEIRNKLKNMGFKLKVTK